jgi:major membrane immunogen (membrane-anchored lipoprotein)
MKKLLSNPMFIFLLVLVISTQYTEGQSIKAATDTLNNLAPTMKDGTYKGSSRSKYIHEPYWGNVQLTIKNGLISDIYFVIRDSNLHETFDGKYEKHFEGNPEYIQQSRNDWKGAQHYPKELKDEQDINKIDAISGATWSYNIFKASVKVALKNAK